jgi:hypothetical protein
MGWATFWVIISQTHLVTLLITGLPNGLFSNPKSQFRQILEGLKCENVDIFYAHPEYFTRIWDIL